jgi:di/tricarboxylate transporter
MGRMISGKFKTRIILSSISIIIGTLIILSPFTMLSSAERTVAVLVVTVITFWVAGIIPEYLTALLFFVVAMLFSIAPAKIVFSGFHSTAFWLVFAGLVIGIGINGTGLGKRVARKVAVHLNGSYMKLIGGLVFIGLAFAFLMPSATGRVVLLVPIAVSISHRFGFKNGSNGFVGVLLAVVLGSFIPAFSILPANVPNMILVGMTESLYQYSPLYGEYLLLHFPILGFLKAIIITALILWLYPDTPIMDKSKPLEYANVMSEKETVLSVVIIILIVLWATDFIHHISPAWIALAGALFLLLPKIDTPFTSFLSLSLSSMFTGIITTMPGVPALLTPLSSELSQTSGFPIESVFMTQVLGFSTPIFPYQVPQILIGLQMSQVKLTEALKVCLYLAVISTLLLLPLNYLWWNLLGWLKKMASAKSMHEYFRFGGFYRLIVKHAGHTGVTNTDSSKKRYTSGLKKPPIFD